MEDLTSKSVKELVDRLNEIIVSRKDLYIEFNMIVNELCERMPDLKGDPNFDEKLYLTEFERVLAMKLRR